MELTSLFSGSDNLFKYLFTLGAVMVLISVFYPLQRKYELQIDINTHNKEVELLNDAIANLDTSAALLSNEADIIKGRIDSLQKVLRTTKSKLIKQAATSQIKDQRGKFNTAFDELSNELSQIKTKKIILDYDQKKIVILQEQVESFHKYYVSGLIIGIAMVLIGIGFWIRIAYHTDILKREEIIKIKKDNARP